MRARSSSIRAVRLYLTFGMALLIVFLVLAAQFESFINPLIIMVTVPLALMGAVLGLWVYASSVNVFSQIGVILLVGLVCQERCFDRGVCQPVA